MSLTIRSFNGNDSGANLNGLINQLNDPTSPCSDCHVRDQFIAGIGRFADRLGNGRTRLRELRVHDAPLSRFEDVRSLRGQISPTVTEVDLSRPRRTS